LNLSGNNDATQQTLKNHNCPAEQQRFLAKTLCAKQKL